MNSLANALEAYQLSKLYSGRAVVDGASLTMCPGEITALVGPSGAGKTTMLRLLAGMERPDAGHISSGEQVLSTPHKHTPPEERRIGLIFQDFALFPHLNVVRNVRFGLDHIAKDDRETVVAHWLDMMDLRDRANAFPHQLSGGEQQRVAIARALAPRPIAILMDEPFSGLDPVLRNQTRQAALSAIREAGIPALMVTHDASEALEFADKIAVMKAGNILQCETSDSIYSRPACLAVAQALGPVQLLKRLDLPTEWQSQIPSGEILYFRQEAIQIDRSSPTALKVERAQRIGGLTALHLKSGNAVIHVTVMLRQLPEIGTSLPVALNSDCVFTFDE